MLFSAQLKNEIDLAYEERSFLVGPFIKEISEKIKDISDEEYRYAVKLIYTRLPLSDIYDYSFELYMKYVENAFFTRRTMPWGEDIPLDIFLSDVLFPRINNEKLDGSRDYFYNLIKDRIKGKTMYDAIVEINYFCFEEATYESTDMRTLAPTSLIKSAYGRCGEEAVFGVNILRSAGIPARSVYTPRWAHCDSNHAWVEAWADGKWYYLGACEPEEVLDRGWFTQAASRAMIIESRSFYFNKSLSPDTEAIKDGHLYNLNLTKAYGKAETVTVRLKDINGNPIEKAKISFEVINFMELTPLNYLYTDKEGKAELTTGFGSIHLHISKDGNYMERLINTKEEENIELIFIPRTLEERISEFDTHAPVDPGNKVRKLSEEVILRHKEKTGNALNKRRQKEEGFAPSPSDLKAYEGLSEKELEEILCMAKGNKDELLKFLNEDETGYAGRLLKTLNKKDYVDLEASILQKHLSHALQYKNDYDEEIFINYILAPRIYVEHLTDYREFICNYFSEEEKETFRKNPLAIGHYIEKNISYREDEELPNIIVSPKGALTIKNANPIGKKLLFTAICRSLGIPSVIAPDTIVNEYYQDGKFHAVEKGEIKDCALKINLQEGINWAYNTNWSIGVLEDGEFKSLRFRNMDINYDNIPLRSGFYRVITGNRLPSGDILARTHTFTINPGEKKEIELSLRSANIEDMLNHVEVGDFKVKGHKGNKMDVSSLLSENNNILFWLQENHEPSQHILNELIEHKEAFLEKDVSLLFILKEAAAAQNSLIAKAMKELNINYCIDEGFANCETSARRVYVDPERLPLIIASRNKLNSIFAISGYNVGTADMLLKIIL